VGDENPWVEDARARLLQGYDEIVGPDIPPHLRAGMERYVLDGVEQGSFLQALFSNDLEALLRADDTSLPALRQLVYLLNNFVPSPAWGSAKAVERWMAGGGVRGRHG